MADSTDVVPLEAEEEGVLIALSNRARPYPVPRSVGRRNVERAFLTAFELIGGVPRLALWADANPTEFYKLYARQLPNSAPTGPQGVVQVNITWASPDRLSYQRTHVIDLADVADASND